MITVYIFGGLTIALYLLLPYLDLRVVKKALGIALVLELFYLIGYFFFDWPFPDWKALIQIVIVVFLGMALGVVFSKLWPIPPKKGFERILRTFLLVTPALGLGIGLQLLLQGSEASQAIYLIFALSSWLGSGHFIRTE
ncbi:MAG: hypothetical protein AB7V16_12970 [Vulcanibacillus sp.]